MTERELKVLHQRIAARMETRADTQALADEVVRLRYGITVMIETCEKESAIPKLPEVLRSLLEG